VSLSEVGAYGQDASGVLQVDEIVGHGSRAQHCAEAYHRGGVAESGAVVHMGRAQQAGQLLHEVVFFIVASGGCQESYRFRPMLFDIAEEAAGSQIQRLIPGDPYKLPTRFLQGILQPLLVVQDLKDGIALGTEGPLACGMVSHILKANSPALLHFQIHAAANRTVGANRTHQFA